MPTLTSPRMIGILNLETTPFRTIRSTKVRPDGEGGKGGPGVAAIGHDEAI